MKNRCKSSGSALIVSLWALLLLSAAIFAWAQFLGQRIDLQAEKNRGLQARAAGLSGVTVALHPLIGPGSALLEDKRGADDGYRVIMKGEAGKLNLNWLLAQERPERLELLRQYLSGMGLNFQQCQRLVDCMLDWVDPDSNHHLNGAEKTPNYSPANRPFLSLEEVERVQGAAPLVSKPGWKEGFTLWSRGPLDLRYADLAAIASLPRVGERRALNFLQYRRGPDKRDFTKDDPKFQGGLPEMLSFLGVPHGAKGGLGDLVTAGEPIFSIVSIGYSGKVQRRFEVVAVKGNGQTNILLWKEL